MADASRLERGDDDAEAEQEVLHLAGEPLAAVDVKPICGWPSACTAAAPSTAKRRFRKERHLLALEGEHDRRHEAAGPLPQAFRARRAT